MSRYEHLNIYKEVYNLNKILFLVVSKYPRDYRITLGNKILNTSIDILELVLVINSTEMEKRESLFSKLFIKLNLLSVYVQISKESNFFNKENTYLSIIGDIGKIQKMSKNWSKS